MAFHNVPPNGFPDLPDVEELEAVVKDVTGLKAELDTVKSGLMVKQNIYGTATKLGDIDADETTIVVTATKNGYLSLVYETLAYDRSINGRIRDAVIPQIGATFNIIAKAYAGEPICTIPCVNGQTYAIEVSAGHDGISIYQL